MQTIDSVVLSRDRDAKMYTTHWVKTMEIVGMLYKQSHAVFVEKLKVKSYNSQRITVFCKEKRKR